MSTNIIFWPDSQRFVDHINFIQDVWPENTNKYWHGFAAFTEYNQGGVVIINGGAPNIGQLSMRGFNDEIQAFRWVLVMSMCDEGSGQHLEWIDHPRCQIWYQDFKPGKYDEKIKLLPSYCIPAVKFLPNYRTERETKPLDWCFSGSNRGSDWHNAIKNLPMQNGYFLDSHLGYEGYMQYLAASKIVPCRPCFVGPETCRLYDALEAGCIPIVGNRPSNDWWASLGFKWDDYWTMLYGEKPPFPVINGPEELECAYHAALDNWTIEQSYQVQAWWFNFKAKLHQRLREDVARLQ